MRIIISILFLITLASCAEGQNNGQTKSTGYMTYSEIRKAVSAKYPVQYDSILGIFSAPANLSAYTNDLNFLTPVTANSLYAGINHTHTISNITNLSMQLNSKATQAQLKDSIASLNAKIDFLSKRIDSIGKQTVFTDTTHMYIIVHAIKDSTELP